MDDEISRNLFYLAKNTTNLPSILLILIEKGIFTEYEADRIKAKETPLEQNSELWQLIKQKNWNENRELILDILDQTTNKHCVKELNTKYVNEKIKELVESHNKHISSETQVSSLDQLKHIHDSIINDYTKMTFPKSVSDDVQQECYRTLMTKLEEEYEAFEQRYNSRLKQLKDDAQTLIMESIRTYNEKIDKNIYELFTKMDSFNFQEKQNMLKEFKEKTTSLSTDIVDQLKGKFEVEMDENYNQQMERLQKCFYETNQQIQAVVANCTSEFRSYMEEKITPNIDFKILNGWKGVNQEKVFNKFNQVTSSMNIPQSDKMKTFLKDQLLKEFEQFLLDHQTKVKGIETIFAEKKFSECLGTFSSGVLLVICEESNSEEIISQKLNSLKYTAMHNFNTVEKNLPKILYDAKREKLDIRMDSCIRSAIGCYNQQNEEIRYESVANQLHTTNDDIMSAASQVLSTAVEAALRKYHDDMDLHILQADKGTISDQFLVKSDETFRKWAFLHFQNLAKESPQAFVETYREKLEMKMDEELQKLTAKNLEKIAIQNSKAEKLIEEIKKLYSKEMSNVLSQEAAPDSLFIEHKHFFLQQKYSDLFMSKCEIQELSSLMQFKQTLKSNLLNALEMAKDQLFERQNEVRKHISVEIETQVQSHHNKISDLLNEKQLCTEEYLKSTHAKVTKSCQSNLNFPSFLTSEERKEYNSILLSHLNRDFELLLSLFENKYQEANALAENVIATIIDHYHKAMEGMSNDLFDKSQLDECHSKEKIKWQNDLLQKVTFFPAEILNQYQIKLDGRLEEAYKIIVDQFEAKLQEMNQRVISIYNDSISQYSTQMDTKINRDREILSEWHELYKEKAVTKFNQDIMKLKMNCDSQRKNLERQLSEDFQSILLAKNADEQKAESYLQDALAKFNEDASNLLKDKSLKADSFSKKLKEIRIAANQYFYDNSLDISQEIINTKKVNLDEQIEKCYNGIYDAYTKLKEEDALLIDTLAATSIFYYQSKMDGLLKVSELVEMNNFESFHEESLKEALQKVPDGCLDSVSQTVKQKINSLYVKYKGDQKQRHDEVANEVKKMMEDLKEEITNVVLQKCQAAKDSKELLDLKEKLKANAQEMLKSFEASGAQSNKQSFIDEVKKHLQETIVKAEKEINSREPQNIVLNAVKNTALKTYEEEMEKHFSATPFMAPSILDGHHKNACNKASHTAKTVITVTPKVTNELDVLFNDAFTKFQNQNRMNTLKTPAVGIDLGTTFSCVAVYNQELKRVQIIPNENGENTTPSYVAFTKDGTELVGEPAKNQAHSNPENTIFDAKRLIGRRFDEDVVQQDIRHWPFKVINENGSPKIQVNDKSYLPEEILAKILTKMKDIAEKHLNVIVANAVITVPAYFNNGQKEATIHAGHIAGLNILGILNEPAAAAIAYSLNETYNKSRNVLIFDFGGGTFDVAILSIYNGKINVKSVGGDTHLGGEDFDNNMVDYCVEQFKNKNGIDLVADRNSEQVVLRGDCSRKLRRLRNECEKRKIDLSGATTATVALDCIHERIDLHVDITREVFEKMNKILFDKSIDIVKKALKGAKLKKEEIDDIVLVGGSTRIPKIQELLTNFFNGRALNRSINPDESVAVGAAVRAAILNGRTPEELANLTLTDVTPLSIGIEIVGGIHSIIIDKNTPIPVKKEHNYTTTKDDQTSVNITIYEGEEKKTMNNHFLGEFVLDGIPNGKKGSADIMVSMEIDVNGILTVNATCKAANISKNLSIQQKK